jgi:cobalt-zinc-cadmium efflux system membrane fusion protein
LQFVRQVVISKIVSQGEIHVSSHKILAMVRSLAVPAIIAGAALATLGRAIAHENHAPLPTKGVTIAGDTIMLSDKAREAIGLTTAKVQLKDIHRIVTVNARVELPWHAQAMITSLVPGKIDKVLVRPGESVVAGQELARVTSAELETLQTALLQAQSEVDLAGKLLDQRKKLEQEGVIAGKVLAEAETAFTEKSAAVEIDRQKLSAIGLDAEAIERIQKTGQHLDYVSITSPIDGVIVHADVRIGQAVSATDHLYHVVDPKTLWIVGDVLESDVRFLASGQSVVADFSGLPGEELSGIIDHLRLKMDPQRRTEGVVIAVENSKDRLRAGMTGRVKISVEAAKKAIACPIDAVIRNRTGTYLLVQRMPGKYENRRVKLGLTEGDLVQILDGAFPGDQVVLAGNSLLAALLGNEHKARVGGKPQETPVKTDDEVVASAHGAIELPTDRQALVAPPIEGRIRQILVQPSQQVQAGDVLVKLDSLQLRSVQLELLQSWTQARLVQRSLHRLEQLGNEGATARRQVWEKKSELETHSLRIDSLKRQLVMFGVESDAIEKLERVDLTQPGAGAVLIQTVPIRAPVAGRIASFNVVPGQIVNRQNTLFEIHDLSKVWVKGNVYEKDAHRVYLGQAARVHFAAYPDLEAKGTLVRISPQMDEKMRVLPVWIEVENPDHLLRDGMLAQVTLMAESTTDGNASGKGARLTQIQSDKK